ncbi:MAG: L-lactate dehydrogenase [Elusimicrobia bacterium]|nr:L-lactate dehydrogenase [Elusimicrobiota bacterium]
MRRIAIVGTGFVGATVAYALLQRGVSEAIDLVDADAERALGEAMDLSHALPFVKNCRVRPCSLDEARGADLVIVCAGRNSVPGETRLDLCRDNAARIRLICAALRAWSPLPVVLVVSNPVDVLTHVAWKEMGRPEGRVLGSGTTLDTARLKTLLGERFGMDPHSIHGYILGEHGDSEFAAWSTVSAGGVALARWPGYDAAALEAVFTQVRTAAYEIIKRKRATYYAVAAAVAVIAEAVIRDQRTVLPVSVPAEGRYGLPDVSLSLPCVLGRQGLVRVMEPELDPAELAALRRSASVLEKALAAA